VCLLGLLAPACVAENTPQITLDTNETLFTVLTAMNACGYDEELNVSDPVRLNVRAEVDQHLRVSDEAQTIANDMCEFYRAHTGPDSGRDLAHFVSLALYLEGPPHFLPKVKEDQLPPDAAAIAGFAALLERFYDKAGIHAIWERHKAQIAALTDRYHEPLSKMLFDTEIYLKLPSAGYLGRAFTIYVDVMAAPGQTNARNYGTDYYVVISPVGNSLKMDQIRHTYLHYLLDPQAAKYPTSVKRLEPLLESVKSAPMDDVFKTDMSLLVIESLIRAVEARTAGTKKTLEGERIQAVDDAMAQGFILTRYFYDALIAFEKDPAGIRSAFQEMLDKIDVKREARRASEVEFAQAAAPELLHLSRRNQAQVLTTAEKRLSAGDPKSAQELAQQALDENLGDQGRALFILAQVAVYNKDMKNAREYFERAIEAAKEPKVVAWSHVYLGRIFDLQEEREAALEQYRAALSAASAVPEVKAAAQRGIDQPYEPPATAAR